MNKLSNYVQRVFVIVIAIALLWGSAWFLTKLRAWQPGETSKYHDMQERRVLGY